MASFRRQDEKDEQLEGEDRPLPCCGGGAACPQPAANAKNAKRTGRLERLSLAAVVLLDPLSDIFVAGVDLVNQLELFESLFLRA